MTDMIEQVVEGVLNIANRKQANRDKTNWWYRANATALHGVPVNVEELEPTKPQKVEVTHLHETPPNITVNPPEVTVNTPEVVVNPTIVVPSTEKPLETVPTQPLRPSEPKPDEVCPPTQEAPTEEPTDRDKWTDLLVKGLPAIALLGAGGIGYLTSSYLKPDPTPVVVESPASSSLYQAIEDEGLHLPIGGEQ